MAQWLKQGTTVNVILGQFVDKTDGVTPETGLTLTVKVSKNGGALAARNSATAIAHNADGYYTVELDDTDTGTLGRLRVTATDSSNALGVWQDFMVVPANVWDSLFGGTDMLQVDAVELSGDSTAADNAEAFFDGTGYAGTNNVIPSVTTVGAVSGAVGSVTGNVGGNVVGSVGSVTGNVGGNVTGSVGSLAAQAKADVNAEVLDVLNVDTFAELTSIPSASAPTIRLMLQFVYQFFRLKKTQTATQQKLYKSDDSTVLSTSTCSDDGTTATVGKGA